jgi:murein DD-endopeptidase MepM/ murein hydrolase activator NlpD
MQSAASDDPRRLRRRWRYVPGPRRLFAVVVGLAAALVPLISDPTSSLAVVPSYLPNSAHQAYGYSLAQMRLIPGTDGRAWLEAAEGALARPQRVETPFDVAAAFVAHDTSARSYSFAVPSGRRLQIDVQVDPAALFVDLFELGASRLLRHVQSIAPAPPEAAAPLERRISLDVIETGEYVLRIQPELESDVRYTLRVESTPLLRFPVDGLDRRAILSGFGAERDGGARAHRGVDIFAPRGTPALAAADAWVARVDSTPRGGNVVWLQSLFGNMRLYYAHLDTQVVRRGQFVRAGEPVGTVGNTGNARTTPTHLHFGVYLRRRGMRGGARDPDQFLD